MPVQTLSEELKAGLGVGEKVVDDVRISLYSLAKQLSELGIVKLQSGAEALESASDGNADIFSTTIEPLQHLPLYDWANEEQNKPLIGFVEAGIDVNLINRFWAKMQACCLNVRRGVGQKVVAKKEWWRWIEIVPGSALDMASTSDAARKQDDTRGALLRLVFVKSLASISPAQTVAAKVPVPYRRARHPLRDAGRHRQACLHRARAAAGGSCRPPIPPQNVPASQSTPTLLRSDTKGRTFRGRSSSAPSLANKRLQAGGGSG